MVALQAKCDSAYNVPGPSHPRIGLEDPMAVPFPAEGRSQHRAPGVELRFRSLRSDPDALSPDGSNTGDPYRALSAPEPGWLADALAALAEADDEIAEEELPPVDEATKAEAARIIRELARRHPLAPAVYPTQDAEIALHFKAPGRTGTFVILLSGGGRADCHAYIGGTSRRAHYDASSDLPDAFVLDQLRHLTPVGSPVSGTGAEMFRFPTALQTLSKW